MDAIENAVANARALLPFDPDGAGQLLAQAQAAQRKLDGGKSSRRVAHAPYDPMRTFAYVARFYGFSDAEMQAMPFPRFLGYVREMNLMIEREKNETRNPQGSSPEQVAAALDDFPRAKEYTGETVAI